MRLTPIEIRQHRFNSRLRGLDRDEVEAFLETVVADFEELVRENAQLRREAERLAREVDALRSREKMIQETLTTAQGVVDQLKRTAIKESETILVDAELRAEKLMAEARQRRADLSQEISELSHTRTRLDSDLRKTLDGYARLIDAFQDAREARTQTPPATPADKRGADGAAG
jgi:cell division initiation protein